MNEATKWVNGKLSKYFSFFSCSLIFSYTFLSPLLLSVYLLDVICLSLKTGHESSSRKRERECNSLLLSLLKLFYWFQSSSLLNWEEGEKEKTPPTPLFPSFSSVLSLSSFWTLLSRRNREWKTLLPSLSIFDLILFHYHVSLMILRKNQESLPWTTISFSALFLLVIFAFLLLYFWGWERQTFILRIHSNNLFHFQCLLISVSDFSSFRFVIFYFMKNANNKSIDRKAERNTQSSKT